MSDRAADDTGIRIFPPLLLLGAIVVAFMLDWIWPTRVILPDWLRLPLGVAFVAAPFLLLPPTMLAFRRAGVEYDVRRIPGSLVTDGPFRFSRNPGYVLGIAFCVGLGLVFDNPWVVLTLVPAIAVLHYGVVMREEKVLENAFGDDYLDYKRRVRRWI